MKQPPFTDLLYMEDNMHTESSHVITPLVMSLQKARSEYSRSSSKTVLRLALNMKYMITARQAYTNTRASSGILSTASSLLSSSSKPLTVSTRLIRAAKALPANITSHVLAVLMSFIKASSASLYLSLNMYVVSMPISIRLLS